MLLFCEWTHLKFNKHKKKLLAEEWLQSHSWESEKKNHSKRVKMSLFKRGTSLFNEWNSKISLFSDWKCISQEWNFPPFKGPFTNTCKGGLVQKGALKIFDPCKGGGLKKITTYFPLKFEFTCFSMGLTCNFHGKKGGGPDFFAVWRGPRKIFAIKYFLHQAPPYKCLWTVPKSNTQNASSRVCQSQMCYFAHTTHFSALKMIHARCNHDMKYR